MAVLKSHQKKGLGKALIHFGENLLQQKKVSIVWCNAREVAVNFYKNNGFNIISKPFHIGDIGLHYVMCKSL
jgi:ribosomal protein S18 acetylase RimI-like enzyme